MDCYREMGISNSRSPNCVTPLECLPSGKKSQLGSKKSCHSSEIGTVARESSVLLLEDLLYGFGSLIRVSITRSREVA